MCMYVCVRDGSGDCLSKDRVSPALVPEGRMGGGKTSFKNLKMKHESECETIRRKESVVISFSFFLKIVKLDVCVCVCVCV